MTIPSFIEKNKDRFLEELLELLRIPSVSADPKFSKEVQAAAAYVKASLLKAGADQAEICPTPGHPIVYAEKIIDPKLPTVLVYGHYDVQPADPYELWDSPPFEPVIKKTSIHPEGAIFARGAADDKGQFYMHIKALETLVATGTLPCNVKFMIEGEEEIGSDHLNQFVLANKDRLKADVILISDTHMIGMQDPSITVGLRGMAYMEVEVTGANRDLHSGTYGGAVANPINVLCQMIASLKDEQEHITLPGFYDKVQELSPSQRQRLNEAPFDLSEYKAKLDIEEVHGEVKPQDKERLVADLHAELARVQAFAKISMRLVPHQDWQEIAQLFEAHLKSIAPASVKIQVKAHHGGAPAVVSDNSLGYRAAEAAMEETFGKRPLPTREGGSIPIVALFQQELGSDPILFGFGLDTDALHSPNEHYGVKNYLIGIETIAAFFRHFSTLSGK
ncbi:MAG: dipeptidase [Cyclobacteriaceae bacterium]|nr:dipeptidase [Cyclobacteriaceae bacterium]